ncbi:uncharacterized protein [Paramisgurnus dabryanus]|uniref:uncharacterized protein n=1 Tax=Paramisgurnus dabryanus TaxID=90735 RepID=UPI0031F37715
MALCKGPHIMCENLQCPVCLDVFTDPVTIPCGHSFCKTCLNACWEYSQDYACPYCKNKSNQKPDMKFNAVLKAIVELYKNNTKGLSSADGPLSEELQCPICLDVFNNPVTTPCGHNFCKTCLKQCWHNSQDCSCPVCKEMFNERPDLKSNTGLREIVQVFEETSGYKRETVMVEYWPALEREDQEETLVKPSDQYDICLDVFSAPCGHNFWKISPDYDWPYSKEKVSERSDLRESKSVWSESEICQCQSSATERRERILNIEQVRMIGLVGNINPNIRRKHERNQELFFKDFHASTNVFCAEEDHKTQNTAPVDEKSAEVKTQLEVTDVPYPGHNEEREINKTLGQKEQEMTAWVIPHFRGEISLY